MAEPVLSLEPAPFRPLDRAELSDVLAAPELFGPLDPEDAQAESMQSSPEVEPPVADAVIDAVADAPVVDASVAEPATPEVVAAQVPAPKAWVPQPWVPTVVEPVAEPVAAAAAEPAQAPALPEPREAQDDVVAPEPEPHVEAPPAPVRSSAWSLWSGRGSRRGKHGDTPSNAAAQQPADAAEAVTPVVPEPAVSEPVVPEPVAAASVVSEPVVPEPVVPQPVVPQPVVPEPVAAQPEVAPTAWPTPVSQVSPFGEPAAPPLLPPKGFAPEPSPATTPDWAMPDILPSNVGGRSLRMPKLRSRALRPPAPVSPQAPRQLATPVPPIPPVAVPGAGSGADETAAHGAAHTPWPVAPAAADGSAGAPQGHAGDQPEATHFAAPVQPAAQYGSLFGAAPVQAETAHAVTTPAAKAPAWASPPVPEAMTADELSAYQLRERSALASEALSELSRLSGYRPQAVQNRGQDALVRRTPMATPGTQPVRAPAPPGPARSAVRATSARCSAGSGPVSSVAAGPGPEHADDRLVPRSARAGAQAGPGNDRPTSNSPKSPGRRTPTVTLDDEHRGSQLQLASRQLREERARRAAHARGVRRRPAHGDVR